MNSRAETQAWLAIHKLFQKLPVCRHCGGTNMKIDGRIEGRGQELLIFYCGDCYQCSGMYHDIEKGTFRFS
jgi:hypothetical protein